MLRAAVANNEAADKDGFTPLYIAAENHAEIIERLLTTGVNEEAAHKVGGTPLYIAAQESHTEIIKIHLAAGANKETANKVVGQHRT